MCLLQITGLITLASTLSLPCLAQKAVAEHPQRGSMSAARLWQDFKAPPAQARLRCYWWWLNGNTDKATITHDLEEMRAKGFGGALLVDADGSGQQGNTEVKAGPMFGSPEWTELYKHALREADRLGLEITLNITSGWNLGGPLVKPEEASKVLTFSRTHVRGGHIAVQLEAPASKNNFYREIAVLAYPLAHGAGLAPQPDDRQGDRHTAARDQSMAGSRSLAFRSAASEGGFSMPETSAMLDDGTSTQFASDKSFHDTKLHQVRDLSASITREGFLSVDLPAGEWEILRVGYTNSDARVSTSSGKWQGLAIDHMSHLAFENYWKSNVAPLLETGKPYKSLRYLATDSWELGGTNWTDDFRAQFTRLRGYDPVLYLPIVAGRIVESRDISTRFLTDLRRTVGDLIASEHYDVFAEHARKYGLGVQAESGGPHGAPIDALETFRHAAVPQTEFWSQNPHRSADRERFFTKEAASAANIYGQHLVAQEGETSIGPQWSESLASDLKPAFDMAITEGMNRLVWHEFTSSPANTGLPGQEYFAGTHLNPKVTWWNAGGAFFAYLNRVQFLMQTGTPVDDVLYFYGANVPNFVRLKADDPAGVLPGYDYDVTNEDALLHTLKIAGSEIVGPSGVRWKVLSLPKNRRLSLPALHFVRDYLRAGGTVSGERPTSPEGMTSQAGRAEYDALVASIWDGCSSGSVHRSLNGSVVCSQSARDALKATHIQPDVEVVSGDVQLQAASDKGIDYVHRRSGVTDIYFVRNAESKAVAFQALFRAHGKHVEFWNPVTGEGVAAADASLEADQRTRVRMSLPPWGSVAVIFSDAATPGSMSLAQAADSPRPLQADWTVSFQPDRGVSQEPIQTNTLTSWTSWAQPGVKFFSGTATYTANVTVPLHTQAQRACLHFSDVREIAEVSVDDKYVASVWAAPYVACVPASVSSGTHRITVRVTNLWNNRLVGDKITGEHFTQTNIKTTSSTLLPSGLTGPVEWIIEDATRGAVKRADRR